MKVLNSDIRDLSFNDIVSFCEEKHVEGIQIEYKKEFPQKGLAKQIAAFSNTRGGIIIIGIEEDPKTGVPLKWEGIAQDGKLLERVHQLAANVEPLPDYDVCTTEEKDGKVFVLIRVFEGNSTPYYVQNDSNIWVRTGNISNPVALASPEALELLFGKREKAQLARTQFLNRANEVHKAALKRADLERKTEIAEQEEKVKKQLLPKVTIYGQNLGTQAAMCTVALQPFYPHKAYIKPRDILESIETFRVQTKYGEDFPTVNKETIPEGVLSFDWHRPTGAFECEQVYGYGLLYKSADVLRVGENGKQFWLTTVARQLLLTLLAAAKYYKLIGYQGSVIGYLELDGVEGVTANRIVPANWFDYADMGKCLLNTYKWEIDTETTILNNPKSLQDLFIGIMQEIYVGLNYVPPGDKLFRAYLSQEGLLSE